MNNKIILVALLSSLSLVASEGLAPHQAQAYARLQAKKAVLRANRRELVARGRALAIIQFILREDDLRIGAISVTSTTRDRHGDKVVSYSDGSRIYVKPEGYFYVSSDDIKILCPRPPGKLY